MSLSPIYCWADVETVGLDPHRDPLLEVAWVFTNDRFELISEPRSFVLPTWHELNLSDYVREMHTVNGLLAEIDAMEATGSIASVAERLKARKQFADDVAALPMHSTLHLAGRSVHFDRDFLRANGFDLSAFHHRMLDLSAVHLMFDAADVQVERPPAPVPAHRALPDVLESIEQARIFRDRLAALHLTD